MALDKRARQQMAAHCGELRDDDGVDPRDFFKPERSNRSADRKARQLCRQVAETLDQVLSGELGDDLLRQLRVVEVVPAPDSTQLLVMLAADCAPGEFDRDEIDRRLAACKGRLRAKVTAAITRRKTPSLLFNVVGPSPAVDAEQKGGGV